MTTVTYISLSNSAVQNQQDKNRLEIITVMLEKLYNLNTRGYYTAWLDWSGHTNGIYIKIIKGRWKKDKKEEIVYESLICTSLGA